MSYSPDAPGADNGERYVGSGPSNEGERGEDKSKRKKDSKTRSRRHVDASVQGNDNSKNTLDSILHRRMESEEMEDHMEGSPYDPDEICKGCGFPRRSSVWCPVTQRHHGTDAFATPNRHSPHGGSHSRTGSSGGASSGNAGKKFFNKIMTKLTPQHNSARHHSSSPGTPQDADGAPPVRGAGLPPLSPRHQPPPGPVSGDTPAAQHEADKYRQAQERDRVGAEEEGGNGEGEQAADSNAQYVLGPDGFYYEYVPEEGDPEVKNPPGNDGNQHPQEPPQQQRRSRGSAEKGDVADGDGDENVQYYCYTDENGETFYYAEEMHESMSLKRGNSTALTSHDGERTTQAPAPEGDAAEGSGTYDSRHYMYAMRNEQGEIVNYVTQGLHRADSDDAAGAADHTATESTTAATSPKRKKTFGDVMINIFKPKSKKPGKGKSDKDSQDGGAGSGCVDLPESMDGAPGLIATGDRDDGAAMPGSSTGGMSICAQYGPSPAELDRRECTDASVTAFVDTLDSSEKKRFDKERKRLVKILEAEEKKERDTLVKQRRVFTEDLDRERRAGLYRLQSDAKVVRRGLANGEPL